MRLSIVSTLYRSEPYLKEFCDRITATVKQITDDYEIVLVNDGSPDHSLDLAISLFEKDARVCVIDLSKNFGHHKAMMTGLANAEGDLVFLIDCDLEIAPETLGDFYTKYTNSSVDVVYGVQERRHGRLLGRIGGRAFYLLHNVLSDIKLPKNLTTARLMSQRYVKALVSHREREVLIGGLWAITGFEQAAIPVIKANKGISAYSLKHKVAVLVDSVTSFSTRPLIAMFYLGAILALAASVSALILVIRWTFFARFQAGWPSLIMSVWLLGGLTIMCLGILGIYLGKIFSEVKQRPYTIIRQIYKRKK